jgi:predicted ATPase/DNA-binding response OmpR family regulator
MTVSVLLLGPVTSRMHRIRSELRAGSFELIEVLDITEAEKTIATEMPPDVILTDGSNTDVLPAIRRWRAEGLTTPILSIGGDEATNAQAMTAGVSDILTGGSNGMNVVDTIRIWLSPTIDLGHTIQLRDRVIDLEASEVVLNDDRTRLSSTEKRLLTFLARRPGRTFTKQELLTRVWGYRPGVVSRTVATTMSRLRVKIEADPANPVHLRSAHYVGYRFDPVAKDWTYQPSRAAVVRGNIRAPSGSVFVGREDLAHTLRQALTSNARLVTLLGPAGVGKTRLANEVNWTLRDDYTGGIWICDLADASDNEPLVLSVARTLGLEPASSDVAEALDLLGETLLVLDNCEGVHQQVAELSPDLLGRASGLRVLATSRTALNVRGEHIVTVPTLPLDTDVTVMEPSAAVSLFVARAKEVRHDFNLTADNLDDIVAIAHQLDGLPLAIELAASRAAVLNPDHIRKRLDDRFALLIRQNADPNERHSSLEAALTCSWDLLHPWEQTALCQCTVFRGGFTMDAAEAVLDLSDDTDAAHVLDTIQALVHHSFLQFQPGIGEDDPRMTMLHSVQAFACARFTELAAGRGSAADTAVRNRHTQWAHDIADETRISAYSVELDMSVSLQRQERANLVAAADWAITQDNAAEACAILRSLSSFQGVGGSLDQTRHLIERVRASPSIDRSNKRIADYLWARSLRFTGDLEESRSLCERLQADGEAAEDRDGVYAAKALLGDICRDHGRYNEAKSLVEQVVVHRQQRGWIEQHIRALGSLGWIHMELGDLPASERVHLEALTRAQDAGLMSMEAMLRIGMCSVFYARRDAEGARQTLIKAIAIFERIGVRRSQGAAYQNLGAICMDLEPRDLETAHRHFSQALAIHREVGNRRSMVITLYNLARLGLRRDDIQAAQQHAERCIALAEQINASIMLAGALSILAITVAHRDEPSTAEIATLFARARDAARGPSVPRTEATLLIREAAVAVLLSDPGQAQQFIDTARAKLDGLSAPCIDLEHEISETEHRLANMPR